MGIAERQPRVITRLPVVEMESGTGTYYTKNLSMGGLFLLTDKRWAVGSEIALAITFGTMRLEFVARVTHLQRDGVGLCFVDPSDDVRDALRRVIASQIPQQRESAVESFGRAVGSGQAPPPRFGWVDKGVRHESVVRDLRNSGAFFEADTPPAVGTVIMVYVPATTQNDDKEIEHELRGCAAEVLRHVRTGFEVRFNTPSAEFRMAIDRVLHGDP